MRKTFEKAIESDQIRQLTALILLSIILALGILYAYFVNSAILGAVETRKVNLVVTSLSATLNEMQEQYLALQNQTTLSKAISLGYLQADEPTYISRKPLVKALSIRDEI